MNFKNETVECLPLSPLKKSLCPFFIWHEEMVTGYLVVSDFNFYSFRFVSEKIPAK